VFITGRSQSELDKAVATIGGNAAAIQGDTSNLADLDRLFATIQEEAGRIDVLAVNAGIYEFGALGEITEEHFDKTFNTNVRGLLFAVQKALPLLSRGSSVILTGSMVSIKGFASCSVYNASKAAVRSLARTWIVDLKGRDIRVNVLSPGYTATPSMSHFMTDDEQASAVATVPLSRIGTPDDLGKAAVFLAADDSAYITGIELFVDGGAAQI
jgi:NAD(P)-dependent dehydrogenase (short-subunit alcohol dehydrogenase family)